MEYPAPPFQAAQRKPCSESDLNPAPLYRCSFLSGLGKLDKKVGAHQSRAAIPVIGRAFAILFCA